MMLGVLLLLLAALVQIAAAYLTAQAMLDGLVASDLLAVLMEPQTLQALAAALGAALFGALVLSAAVWRRRAVWLVPMLLPWLWPVTLRLGPDTPILAIVLIHAASGLALGTLCGAWRMARVTTGMLRAAVMCGVSPIGAWRRVILPVLLPGVIGATLLAGLSSLLLSFLRAQADGAIEFADAPSVAPMAGLGVVAVLIVSGLALGLVRKS